MCRKCGTPFWAVGERDTCGEAPCDPYTFLDRPLVKREYDLDSMREEFLSFFERRGHTRIRRYPVVARWRNDVFLVNASIYDFQPHVTSGKVPPPANPLTISQPCIRLVDTDKVGRTGRHLTSFEMMAHHAFNYPDHHVYWMEETVAYAHEFLTETLGVPEEYITYKENPWVGGGNAGSALEVIVGGLEVATLVFMDLVEDESGDVEIKGVRYRKMDVSVVDTGYGLERFVWLSRRTPTIYEAIYPEVLNALYDMTGVERDDLHAKVLSLVSRLSPFVPQAHLMERIAEEMGKEGHEVTPEEVRRIVEPIQRIYIIADHARSILLMLTDGVVPSNVKEGYLARMLIRRALRTIDEMGCKLDLYDVVKLHAERLSGLLNMDMMPVVEDMLRVEEERYRETMKRGEEIVRRTVRKKGRIDLEDLILLYESHGLPPEFVKSVAAGMGVEVEIPENFHALISRKHERAEVERKKERKMDLPPTRLLYYEDAYMREFDAKVIWSEGNEVALDATAFYPEGGGQPCDLGELRWDGGIARVTDVQKYGDVVVHTVDQPIPVGVEIRGRIDWERRYRHMRMHTATHVLLSAARDVLGRHVWQAGAQKGATESRLDIAHYRPLSRDDVVAIERAAFEKITSCLPVSIEYLPREEAERRYGFVLYQGGVPEGRIIRVVKVENADVEGCGGTHVRNTGEIGFLKIIRTERIQDGVVRIIFAAGPAALEEVQRRDDLLLTAAKKLGTEMSDVPTAVERLQAAWKEVRKEVERLRRREAEVIGRTVTRERVGDVEIRYALLDVDLKTMREVSLKLSGDENVLSILVNTGGHVMVGSTCRVSAAEVAKVAAEAMGGRGGGREDFAQGKGADPSRAEEALKLAVERAREMLNV